jgi:cobalt/nickel transport system permease protein
MNRYAGFWHHALFNGYDFRHDAHPAVGYVISAVVGAAAISVAVLAVLAAARVVQRRGRRPTVGASP